jgi:uncharacterized membrane protein
MAGIYFAFSAFIMRAFDRLETTQSVAAMNAINKTILGSWFMPLFFGTTIVSVILMIVALANWGDPDSGLMLITGVLYFTGMFVCTAVFNVPLNKLLAGLNEDSTNTAEVWRRYLRTWTGWNHIRTVSLLITCGLCIWLLSA